MLLAAMILLAQIQQSVTMILPSEQKLLSGAVKVCSAEIDPSAGAYTLTLWMPYDSQKWYWTWLEEPFLGKTNMNACTAGADNRGCKQKWVITRFAPYSSVNYVPDGYSVAFTCERCYHAFFVQGGQSRDLCYPQEAQK